MAARSNKIRQDEQTRAKIQAALIIGRLQDCVLGKVVLDAQQVSSAKALLNKVLPDLQSVEVNADVTATVVASKPLSPDEWAAQHSGDED